MAFMEYIYTLIDWKNKSESLTTPIGKTNLRHMDEGIKTIGDNLNVAYEELNTGKLDKDTAYNMVSDVSFDESTGIFTVTKLNGSTFTIDTKLEKITTNWTFDKDSQQLILTLDDGTKQEVDLSALITQYEFLDTDTIAFTIGSDGKVSANVKDGSVTEEKLQPNYLADIREQASNASASATQASYYSDDAEYDAKLAQSYAIGGSGVREGEDEDNAKISKEEAQKAAEEAKKALENMQEAQVTGVKGSEESEYRKGLVNITKENIGLDKVDNTADKDKSVKYADSAGTATKATQDGNGNVISDTYATHKEIEKVLEMARGSDSLTKSITLDMNTAYLLWVSGSGTGYDIAFIVWQSTSWKIVRIASSMSISGSSYGTPIVPSISGQTLTVVRHATSYISSAVVLALGRAV